MMVSDFPSPVLSVAVDVLRDLDGKDALSGLWKRESTAPCLACDLAT
jgi:hypothetical protein